MKQAQDRHRRELAVIRPEGPGALELRETLLAAPGPNEIEVAVEGTSVNPIDVRRSHGYGRRLLSLIGAGKFPLILGNDFAGTVTRVGGGVRGFAEGDKVYGTKKASTQGTHVSHCLVSTKKEAVLKVPEGAELNGIAVLPYCFTTMWLALRAAGLTPQNAAGKKILVQGAAGGLGVLSLQLLSSWGAEATALSSPSVMDDCRKAGASVVLDGYDKPYDKLEPIYDATLNFATFAHDPALVACLRKGALGHATVVHPIMQYTDELGLIRGGLKIFREKRRLSAGLPEGAKNYAWVLFSPSAEALRDLDKLIRTQGISLPIGVRTPLAEGVRAFQHIESGLPGRALIMPQQ